MANVYAENSRPGQTSLCFNLPAELRNRIYFLVLPKNMPYGHIWNIHAKAQRARLLGREVPAVCQTSHQLRSESMPIWRATNRFFFVQMAPAVYGGESEAFEPSMDQILLPHLDGFIEYTRYLRWSVVYEKVLVPGEGFVNACYSLDIDDDQVKVSIRIWGDNGLGFSMSPYRKIKHDEACRSKSTRLGGVARASAGEEVGAGRQCAELEVKSASRDQALS